MKILGKGLTDDRGMVLVISLSILTLLIVAGVGAVVSVQTDLKITRNLLTGAQAFYIAEAGIEWGKQQIKNRPVHPPDLASGSQGLSAGVFNVSFLAPAEVTNLVARVAIQSTGTVHGSFYTIQASVTKSYDLSDGVIGIKGNEGHSRFVGDSFLIDGRDYDPETGRLVPEANPKPAISVSSEAIKGQVEGALTGDQQARLIGEGEITPSIRQTTFLSSEVLAQLATQLCSAPEAILANMPPEGTLSVSGQTTWGTRVSPQIRCINGLTGPGDKIEIGGPFSGAGVLVVKDADLVLAGDFRWEGLILITGNHVGFRVEGGGSKDIFGSVAINERDADSGPGTEELGLQGIVSIRHSTAALARAAALFPRPALEMLYPSLPSRITQNYWRTVSH